MRAILARRVNDIVSLVVMGLMIAALVAGQAGAAQPTRGDVVQAGSEPLLVTDIDFSFRHEGE